MAAFNHGFCGLHRIGYDRRLDATCPQCTIAHLGGAQQYDFDTASQLPVAADGKTLLAPLTMQPTGATVA